MSGIDSSPSTTADSTLHTKANGASSLRADVLVFLFCYLSLIGATIGFMTLVSAVLAIQMG